MRYKATQPQIVKTQSESFADLCELANYVNELKAETESAISGLAKQIEVLKKIKKE